MTVARTNTLSLAIDPRALRLVAADAGTSIGGLVVVRRERHGKSDLAFVSAGGAAAPTHVIKMVHQAGGVRPLRPAGLNSAGRAHSEDAAEPASERSKRYSPCREFEGLRYARRLADPAARLGALVPIGFGVEPSFLVTRYQPGRAARGIIDAAIRDGRPDDLGAAGRCGALIGLWLARLRAPEHARANGLGWAGVRRSVVEAAARAGAIAGGGEVLTPLPGRIDRLIAALGADGARRAGLSLPAHGDLRPQNFLLDGAGVLCPVDLESFDWRPLGPDLARLRVSFELAAIQSRGRGRAARDRAARLWEACVQSYAASGGETGFELVRYLLRVLERLNWAGRPGSGLGRAAPRAILRRLRERLWIRDRLRWLRELPADLDGAVARYRSVL